MTVIRVQDIDGQAVLPIEDFQRLLALARKSEPVEVLSADEELTTQAMMRLAESSGAFDFLNDPGEDVYSADDGEPI